jgi:site-specific recombinase XerD
MCLERFPEHTVLDEDIAMAWAECGEKEHPNTQIRRISPVRGLAEFMLRRGKNAFVIPRGIPAHEVDYVPYIYTKEEMAALFNAADMFVEGRKNEVKSFMLPCVIRLLYATGMRHGEARLLRYDDVDLERGQITVGASKNSEGRLVYINDDVCSVMAEYNMHMHKTAPGREWFFSKADGTHYVSSWLQQSFMALKFLAGIEQLGVTKRLHDIRHTYCVHRLNEWVAQGEDIEAMLPYLCAYIGHKTLESTDYYLHLVPEFFPEYSELVHARNRSIPKVSP